MLRIYRSRYSSDIKIGFFLSKLKEAYLIPDSAYSRKKKT